MKENIEKVPSGGGHGVPTGGGHGVPTGGGRHPNGHPQWQTQQKATHEHNVPTRETNTNFYKTNYEEHVMNELIMKKIPSGGGQSVAIGCPLKEEVVVPTGGGPSGPTFVNVLFRQAFS